MMANQWTGPVPEDQRFPLKYAVSSDGCWEWTGAINEAGYGIFALCGGKTVRAHRWAYERYVGPISPGLQIDHLCRNRKCVNPAHLEPVTCRENVLRGHGPSAFEAKQTHCINGHPFKGSNLLLMGNGRRICRECNRARSLVGCRAYRARKNALRPPKADICKRGHTFTIANTYTAPSSGRRQCRECIRMRQSKAWLSKQPVEAFLNMASNYEQERLVGAGRDE